jgi:hypothetical protein
MLRRHGPDQKKRRPPSRHPRAGNKRISPPPTHATGCQSRYSQQFQNSPSRVLPPLCTSDSFYVVANFKQIMQSFHQFVRLFRPQSTSNAELAARAFPTFRSCPSFAYLFDGSPRATRDFNWSIYIPPAPDHQTTRFPILGPTYRSLPFGRWITARLIE